MRKNREMNDFLMKIKKLELDSEEGKINFRWGLGLIALAAGLTAKDWILSIICHVVEVIKTCVLKRNVVEETESANVILIIILVMAFFILCIEILYYHDTKKRQLKDKIVEKENNQE